MGIVRVLVVRVSGACAGEGQAAVLAQLGHTLGTAGHDVEADEVAALGVRPVGDVAAGSQLLVEGRLDGIKAGYQTAAVLCHVGQNAFLVLEEADVTQLVHLIIADDHDREAFADVLHHGFAAGQCRDACAREGDLAGRGEHEHTVLIAVLLALVQQHRGLDDLIGEVVHDVGLIPEDLEVGRSGLHLGEALDGLIAVGVAVGVGILRHAPDALDGIILSHQLLNRGAINGATSPPILINT